MPAISLESVKGTVINFQNTLYIIPRAFLDITGNQTSETSIKFPGINSAVIIGITLVH